MNIICILANDMFKFKRLVYNLPENLINTYFCIFNEERIGDKKEEIEKIISKRVKKYKIVGTSEVIKQFKKIVYNDFVQDYTMGLNILMQWYIIKNIKNINNILSLDDDIILTENCINVFEGNSKFKIDSFRKAQKNICTKRQEEIIKEFFRIFNLRYDKNKYFLNYVNAGHFILNVKEIDVRLYENALVNFFESEIIKKLWKDRRSYTSYQLDEKFITLLAIANNISNNELNKDVKMLVEKSEKISDRTLLNSLKNKSIIHICNCSNKNETYKRLKNIGDIK